MARPRRWPLAAVLLVTYAVTVLLVLAVFGFLVDRAARDALLGEMRRGLSEQVVGLAAVGEIPDPQAFATRVAGAVEARVTIIARDGSVLGDSLRDPETLENHASRPEVQDALAGRVGTDRRISASTGFEQLYVAAPGPGDIVIRLSIPENAINQRLAAFRSRLWTLAGLAALSGVAVVGLVARRLASPLIRLAGAASAVAIGERSIDLPRSAVSELDDLARSVASMADDLRQGLLEAETERRTLATVLESLPQGTLLVGADDSVIYANSTVGQFLGPVPGQLDRVTPFRIQEMVRRTRLEGSVVDSDLEHGRPTRFLRVIATPLEDRRVLVVVADVTERRRLDDIRRDFVTNASHELKTPVASILASAETLQVAVEKAPDRIPQFAAQIEQAARSLARLIADLLDLSRLEGRTVEFNDVALAEVVNAEVELLRKSAIERQVTLSLDVEPVRVVGSASDLGLAVRNLIDNALRYTEAGGAVRVSVGPDGDDARVVVTDTGAGIPQRDLDRIFERFYRVDDARSRATGGTGLGLSIVRHVVELHGGTVAVVSQLGAGSTFTITVPAVVKGVGETRPLEPGVD